MKKIRVSRKVYFAQFKKLKSIINSGELQDHHFHADYHQSKLKKLRNNL